MNTTGFFKADGHVLIKDRDSGEIILDKSNSIHLENMSEAIALTLAHRGFGQFNRMVFGNGASTVSGTGQITYFPANVEGQDATLYNPTYTAKIIDDNNQLNTADDKNYMEVVHVPGNSYTDIVVHAFLDYAEPSGQEAFDDGVATDGTFVFDELGIMSYPRNGNGAGRLLTHCIFNPIQKSLNRAFEIVYTIRIYMAQ
jgi:hypothetical protein